MKNINAEPTQPPAVKHDPLILGVFSFLDHTLPEEERQKILSGDSGVVVRYQYPRCARDVAADIICAEFSLSNPCSRLRGALDEFRLYYEKDMSDALAMAYIAQLRGQDWLAAFREDYSIKDRGLLYWSSADDVENDFFLGSVRRKQVKDLYRRGDLFVNCCTAPFHYLFHIRGDRLVNEFVLTHANVGNTVSTGWLAAIAKFNEMGGTAAFLKGKFIWPPEGWVNPVDPKDDPGLI